MRGGRSVGRVRALAWVAAALAWVPMSSHGDANSLYDRLWPRYTEYREPALSQLIADRITDLGNALGAHLDALSYELVAVRFDGRRRRAFFRFGGGDQRFLRLQVASDVKFTAGLARVHTRIDLAIRGRALELELPELEMAPASYRGERGIEIRVPLVRRRF